MMSEELDLFDYAALNCECLIFQTVAKEGKSILCPSSLTSIITDGLITQASAPSFRFFWLDEKLNITLIMRGRLDGISNRTQMQNSKQQRFQNNDVIAHII